jgi:hypothetical protein
MITVVDVVEQLNNTFYNGGGTPLLWTSMVDSEDRRRARARNWREKTEKPDICCMLRARGLVDNHHRERGTTKP